MNNEKLIEQIDELIGMHRQLKTDGNDILSKVRCTLIKKSSDEYEKGLNDAWKLARKIGGDTDFDGYNCTQLYEIFNSANSCTIFDKYSCQEALAKLEKYEKKKAEEESKLVPGDVVIVNSIRYGDIKGIFIKYEDDEPIILTRRGGSMRLVGKNVWNIDKTGEHVDISELKEVLYD